MELGNLRSDRGEFLPGPYGRQRVGNGDGGENFLEELHLENGKIFGLNRPFCYLRGGFGAIVKLR